jgi:hypothetical protein
VLQDCRGAGHVLRALEDTRVAEHVVTLGSDAVHLREKRPFFLNGFFPMFVPSLSWKTDRF